MSGRFSRLVAIGLGFLAAFSIGGVTGYKFAESRQGAGANGPRVGQEELATGPSESLALSNLQQQVVARQRFASQMQTYFQDQNFHIVIDTRSMPNEMVRGDLHDVLKMNCQVCGRKDLAEALLRTATPEKLRELGFVSFMVGKDA